jgi:integrase/recombinase XerC
VPKVRAAVTAGTLKAYGSYWDRMVEAWPDRRLTEATPIELSQLAESLRSARVRRRNGRNGDGTVENFIGAARCLYKHAVAEGYLKKDEDPSQKISKPRRPGSVRSALAPHLLAELSEAAATTGDDPELDALIVRLHSETACRRGGALNLRPCDLDRDNCMVRLREKAGRERWQPVSPTLMRHLVHHARTRHAPDRGRLLRYPNGKPITYRRYDHLFNRLGKVLEWVAKGNVSAHWIRHTILTWVERNFGLAVAEAYAGHEATGEGSTTLIYAKATLEEVAQALSVLTGEPHPLARQPR